MRRSTATVIGAAVIAVSVGAGTTAAIGAAGGGSPSAKTQARHIAASLATAKGRAHYGFTTGRLVSADVCVRDACVHRTFSKAPVCNAGAACIGSALVARKFAHGVTISAELA
jgi:predicted lipoprotein with Yx(FWY)xxD motif